MLVLGISLFLLTVFRNILFAKPSPTSTSLTMVLVGFILCSIVELILNGGLLPTESLEIPLRLYYVVLGMTLAFLLEYAVFTVFSDLGVSRGRLALMNLGLALSLIGLLVVADWVIAGVDSIDYSVTRIAGGAYWAVPVYAALVLLSCFGVLIRGYFRARHPFAKVEIVYALLGMGCLFLPIAVVLPLMLAGFEVNATVVLPLGMLCFLGMTVYTSRNNSIKDPRVLMPFSRQRAFYKAFKAEFLIRREDELSIRDQKKNLEKVLIARALRDYEGILKQWEIADKIGISHSGLSKKRRDYDI